MMTYLNSYYVLCIIAFITLPSCGLIVGYKSNIVYTNKMVAEKAKKYEIPIEKTYLLESNNTQLRYYVGLDIFNGEGKYIHQPSFDSCSYTPINFVLYIDTVQHIPLSDGMKYDQSLNRHKKLIESSLTKDEQADMYLIFYWSYRFYGFTKLYLRRLRKAIEQHPQMTFNLVYVNTDVPNTVIE